MRKIVRMIVFSVLIGGLCLLAYPTFSNWWNSMHQTEAVRGYVKETEDISGKETEKLIEKAKKYNRRLSERSMDRFNPDGKELDEYKKILDLTDTGIMAVVEIPKLKIKLPVYHGVNEGVLQIAVGHIPGSSFPVGGKGTHAVLSGHTGLISTKLFTDIDKLENGDIFTVTVLNRILTYKVDQRKVVLPDELEDLAIDKDKDYVTLQTCTPYGVNTHRLLIRGERTGNVIDRSCISGDAVKTDPVIFTAVSMFIVIVFAAFMKFSVNLLEKKLGGRYK